MLINALSLLKSEPIKGNTVQKGKDKSRNVFIRFKRNEAQFNLHFRANVKPQRKKSLCDLGAFRLSDVTSFFGLAGFTVYS